MTVMIRHRAAGHHVEPSLFGVRLVIGARPIVVRDEIHESTARPESQGRRADSYLRPVRPGTMFPEEPRREPVRVLSIGR